MRKLYTTVRDIVMPIAEGLRAVLRPYRMSIDFPDELRAIPKNYRGVLVNEHTRCIGCRLCAKVCPSGAIELYYEREGRYKPGIDYGKCVFCGLCVEVCPTGSLRQVRFQEIVTDDVSKLRFRAVYLTPDRVLKIVRVRSEEREVTYVTTGDKLVKVRKSEQTLTSR